ASKTFTTQETMANAERARQWGARHFYAVTANVEAAKRFGVTEVLPMWDWVGGRYSVWSAVGFAAMCAIGPQAFDDFLAGGREMDEHFGSAPVEQNIPALLGLVGGWNAKFLRCATHARPPSARTRAPRPMPSPLAQMRSPMTGACRPIANTPAIAHRACCTSTAARRRTSAG